MTRRRGAALLELVVALPLLLLVAALAVQGFVAQLQVVTAQETRLRNVRELEHAALALAADLRPIAAADLEAWSDTAVVAAVPVLRGFICGTPASHLIDVAIGDSASATRAVALADPRNGDVYSITDTDSAVAGIPSAQLDTRALGGALVAADVVASACVDSPIRGTGSPWRLTLAAPLATPPVLGTPISVGRRTEWRAYRASDARYYLGRRDWTGGGWSTMQPVAGPLLAPARGGLVLRVLRADGSSASGAPSEARQVELELRAPRTGARGRDSMAFDSLRVRLALRGGAR
jgi:hypothetical protein